MKRNRAFLLTDMLTGLVICGALLAATGTIASRWVQANEKLGSDRAAVEAARQTLLNLQQRLPRPEIADARIEVRPLSDHWVEVSAEVRSRKAVLIGLLPEGVNP